MKPEYINDWVNRVGSQGKPVDLVRDVLADTCEIKDKLTHSLKTIGIDYIDLNQPNMLKSTARAKKYLLKKH